MQLKYLIKHAYLMATHVISVAGPSSPKPYKSLLTEGCLETGCDFNDNGAVYDYCQMMFMGIPNLADSLAAVRELIYKRKKYAMKDLVYHLKHNFPDESVRLDFVNNAPKFGNDIAAVDNLAAEIMETGCDYLKELSDEYGYPFHAQVFSFLWMVNYGITTAATPDGRRNGAILAESMSPVQGHDFNGFIAFINSLLRLPAIKAPATVSAVSVMDPKLFNDKNIPLFADIMLSAAERGLSSIQFDVVDTDSLIDAKINPDKYKNLAVRVSGFSQYFNLLPKELQDHVIERTHYNYM